MHMHMNMRQRERVDVHVYIHICPCTHTYTRTCTQTCTRATANRARTIRSPSPTHLLMRHDAEIEKNVALDSVAIVFPINVFPVPGGPNKSSPFGGPRRPVNRSGRSMGHTTISWTELLANSSPAMSSQDIPGLQSVETRTGTQKKNTDINTRIKTCQ